MPDPMRREAFSLLELIAVVAVLGVLAVAAVARFGPAPLKNAAARADARRLTLDLLQTQRRSIATGDNHYLEFTLNGSAPVGYTLYRRLSGGGTQAVDGYREFAQGETITTTHNQLEYNFSGAALAAYQVSFAGPDQRWRVTVIPVTGAARVDTY